MRRVLAQRRRPAPLLTVAPIWTVLSVGAWADDVNPGRKVYADFCVSCHGRDMVAPGGVTFDLRKFPKDDFERFRKTVFEGNAPAMPAWRDKISDDDVKLLWACVRGGGLIPRLSRWAQLEVQALGDFDKNWLRFALAQPIVVLLFCSTKNSKNRLVSPRGSAALVPVQLTQLR
jgi:hypothetical protein